MKDKKTHQKEENKISQKALAYIAKQQSRSVKKSVIQMAKKKQTLNRHLEVEVPDHIYEELLALVEEGK